MLWTKVRIMTVLLMVVGVAGYGGGWAIQALGENPVKLKVVEPEKPDRPKQQATEKLLREFAVQAKDQKPLELIELWKRWLEDADKRKEFGLENEAFQTALTKWVGERLVRLLKEGNGNAEAAIALGRLGDREYVKDLVALYRNEDCDG